MTDTIEKALTAEEWKSALANEFVAQAMLAESCDPVRGNDQKRAALSLHGKPFGFTPADVSLLRSVLTRLGPDGRRHAQATSLLARIAALLPE